MGPAVFLRTLALVAYLILVVPLMWIGVILRVLHGPLRMLGVPNQWLPLDVIASLFAQGIMIIWGVEVDAIGKDRVKSESTIFMANHSSGLDPFIIAGSAPLTPLFIFKRELMFYFPPVFLLGYLYGHVPIRRKNRDDAIKSLQKAARKVKKYHRSICIFPEGTRTTDGKLQVMKSGPFYMAKDAQVSITPVYIKNAYELLSKGSFIPREGGVVICEYLPQIRVTPNDTVEDIKKAVEDSLQAAQTRWEGHKVRKGGRSLTWTAAPLIGVFLVLFKWFL